MSLVKVLFIPAGSGMAISAIKSLRHIDDIKTIAADSDSLAPGLYLADQGYVIPPFSSQKFFPFIKKIIKKEQIDILYPCLDPLLEMFAEKDPKILEEDLGVKISLSSPKTIRITRDKWLSYQYLKNYIDFPKSWIELENVPINSFPLFIKPRKGSGSINAMIIKNQKELEFFFNYIENPIIQEYLTGKEFTIDCLISLKGDLLTLIPRERIQSKAGISVKARMIHPSDTIIQIAKTIVKHLDFKGPFFFQLKEDGDGKLKLMEINARLSGTMIFSSLGGFNIVEQAIRLLHNEGSNEDSKFTKQPLLLPERDFHYRYLFMSRYWEEIFITSEELKKSSNSI